MNAEEPENEEPKPVPLIPADSPFPYPADTPAARTQVIAHTRMLSRGVDATRLSENGTITLVQVKHGPARTEPPSSERDGWVRSRLRVRMLWVGLVIASIGGGMATGPHMNAGWGTAWIGLVTGAAAGIVREAIRPRPNVHVGRSFSEFSARCLTAVAARLAGRRRAAVSAEWRTHLAGYSGHDPATWEKVPQALGFVGSAIQYRYSDVRNAAWSLIEAVLKSRTLSNLFVLIPTASAAYVVLRHEGTLGVVKAAESIGMIGGTLYGLIRTGRWWRNVKPPEPKARRAKE
jgi:hypothetical protein